MTADKRCVLITGCSTGIGEAAALRLDRAGWRVFAGVRREEDGRRLLERGSPTLQWVLLDVTDRDSVRAAAARVETAVGSRGLDGLVNNAGIAVGGPLEFLPETRLRRQFEVNVFGLLAVTQALLPLLRRARGRVVNIGSVSGLIASPMIGPYSASKHAVEALTDAMRLELAPWGIEVSIVDPGPVRTPIWDKGEQSMAQAADEYPPAAREMYQMHFAAFRRILAHTSRNGMAPERPAALIERALTVSRPRPRYILGLQSRFRLLLQRALPRRWMDALVLRVLRRAAARP